MPNTPSQQYYSPDPSQAAYTTPRNQPLPPSTQDSPATSVPSSSPSNRRHEPYAAIPPRSSSKTADSKPSRKGSRTEDARQVGYASGGERDDAVAAAAAASRSKRRNPPSPETPQKTAGSRDANRSATNTGLPREESTVLRRDIVTDPTVDVAREQERLAEAQPQANVTPVTGLGLVSGDGVDDGGRGAGRSRQDFSATTNRRKDVKFGEYILGQTLGEGEFGKVKLGWKKDGTVQVAIKLIRRESLGTNPSRLPKIYREISILRELSHPNIVRLHEMVETDRHIGIILEYASGGELFDYILNHRYLKDNAARRLFAQLISGVGYLHKKGIVHRDLKLENLLLDRNRNIIITDFGFANTFDPNDELGEEIEYQLTNRDFVKKMGLDRPKTNGLKRGDLMQTSCGSPCYAAPELVVSDSLYTGRKVDVWSCGVILVC